MREGLFVADNRDRFVPLVVHGGLDPFFYSRIATPKHNDLRALSDQRGKAFRQQVCHFLVRQAVQAGDERCCGALDEPQFIAQPLLAHLLAAEIIGTIAGRQPWVLGGIPLLIIDPVSNADDAVAEPSEHTIETTAKLGSQYLTGVFFADRRDPIGTADSSLQKGHLAPELNTIRIGVSGWKTKQVERIQPEQTLERQIVNREHASWTVTALARQQRR
jgi:hypothetical protein